VVVPVFGRNPTSVRSSQNRVGAEPDGRPYEIVFVLDPSPDRTEEVILEEIGRNPTIALLVLSRRFGQPAATMAGILSCRGDVCVVIDVDLQDQPELIEPMYGKLREGYEVVFAKRRTRKGETLIKRAIAHVGYAVISRLSDVEIPRNTGDFRIITRRVIEELRRLNESHGSCGAWWHLSASGKPAWNATGTSHFGRGNYSRLTGSLRIGLNRLVGFSSRPLQLMSLAGVVVAGFSFLSARGTCCSILSASS
jgi:dolichol-phosphate mannosyltransferase